MNEHKQRLDYVIENYMPDKRQYAVTIGIKMCFIILILLPCIELFSQNLYFDWEGIINEKNGAVTIPNATVRVFSDGRVFVFAANDVGKVNIRYYRPTASDSILITSVGYVPLKLSCNELQKVKEIQLEEDIYTISDIVITPVKKKTIKLGNKAFFTIKSIGTSFDMQMGLLIKNDDEIFGRILTVNYYMASLPGQKTHQRPFRVMIYDMDTLNNKPGKDILGEYLIVSLNNGRGWFEVDVSHYNIMLPSKGVFVGMEVLPIEYYLSNEIINSPTYKLGKYNVVNSVSFGATTHSSKSESSYESWEYRKTTGWNKRPYYHYDFLINIVVEVK